MEAKTIEEAFEERRITNYLLDYWKQLSKDGALPLEQHIDPDDIMDAWQNCFMVQLLDIERGMPHYNYTYLGMEILLAHDSDIKEEDSPPLASASAEQLHAKYQEVIEAREPVVDEGEFLCVKGSIIKYRQVLLPFSSNGKDVDVIFGGMRYRVA